MKVTFKILAIILFTTSCSSKKLVLEKAPVKIVNAFYNEWYGGTEQSGSGFLLKVEIDQPDNSIVWKEAFFHGMVTEIKSNQKANITTLQTRFNRNRKVEDYSSYPRFNLSSTEAIFSFIDGSGIKYFKVTGITLGKPIIYQ